jgi:hypothetical protein
MKRITTIAALAAATVVLAPAALGAGTPLPPIDAGSNQPNPIYTHRIPPIDAGSVASGTGGFPWVWTAMAIGVALAVGVGAALTVVLRRRGPRASTA